MIADWTGVGEKLVTLVYSVCILRNALRNAITTCNKIIV